MQDTKQSRSRKCAAFRMDFSFETDSVLLVIKVVADHQKISKT